MTIFDSIIQGIIQGFTEFLPISSSGHLMIAQYFLGIKENNLFLSLSLHVGTLLSVLIVYKDTFIKLFKSIFSLPSKILSQKKKTKEENLLINLFWSLVPLTFLLIPIPGIGNLKKFASYLSSSGNIIVVGLSLIATSILLFLGILSTKNFSHSKKYQITPFRAFLIGVFQSCAGIFPGLSRSGSTLSCGLMLGIERHDSLDFSFILGTPTILLASLIEFKEVHDLGVKIDVIPIIVGIIVSAIVGCLSIKLFKWLLSNDKTWIFAIYSFLVGLSIVFLKLLNFI